jgi:esterase/lipase superfamily enzyme
VPPWEYHNDRDDAEASGKAMARFLMRFIDFLRASDERCDQCLHLVAHSMGNWVLRHAVQGIRSLLDDGRLPTLFENIFLMAADEDEDALKHDHKLGFLSQLCRAALVYHSPGDGALIISDTTKFNPDRLGADGPKTFSGLSNRIVAIDCGEVDFTQVAHVNQQYYRLRPEVITDVRHLLSGRFRPDAVPGRVVVESGRRYRIRR